MCIRKSDERIITSGLKLDPITVVAEFHLVICIGHENVFDKTLDSFIKHSSDQKTAFSEQLVFTARHFLVDILPKHYSFNKHIFKMAIVILWFGNLVILFSQ